MLDRSIGVRLLNYYMNKMIFEEANVDSVTMALRSKMLELFRIVREVNKQKISNI